MAPARRRVAIIHHSFVPRYRVRFYELLQERSEIEYVVFHGPAPSQTGHLEAPGPFAFPNVWTDNRQLRISGRTLIYQPIVRRVMATRWDAIIFAPYVRLLSNLILVPLLKARGSAVIAWGHGFEKEEDHGPAVTTTLQIMSRIKARFVRSVDGYLVHTPRGADWLTALGLAPHRVHVVGNTIDMSEQIALHARLANSSPEAIRGALGLGEDSVALLYIGRIYKEKRVGELLEVVRRLRASRPDLALELVVIGDGPGLPEVRSQARGLDGVHFRGEVYDQEEIARHMRVASAVVIPGAVGLAANHSLAHGVPVITRDSPLHAPEVDYIEPGANGLIVQGGLDEFTTAIADFIASPDLQRTLANGALRTRSELTLDHMVRAFDEGVAASLP
jgi:glycosyltransferase involved in cell wall biosynthesis